MNEQESKLLEAFRQSNASFQNMIMGLACRCADASNDPNHYVWAGKNKGLYGLSDADVKGGVA